MKKDFNAAREGWDGITNEGTGIGINAISTETLIGSTETIITREGTGACITLKV